jgi:hypothetical protein
MFVCDYMVNLYGKVQSSRMSGFTQEYTKLILSALYSIGNKDPEYKTPNDPPWPIYPAGSVITPTPKSVSEFEFGLHSNKSQTTTSESDIERQGSKILEPKLVESSTIHDDTATNRSSSVTGGNNIVLAERITSVPVSLSGSTPLIHIPEPTGDESSTHRIDGNSAPQSVSADTVLARPSTPEQEHSASVQIESSGSSKLLGSPNTMNKLNEQDPAFRRTIDALRQVDNRARAPARLPALDSVLNIGSLQSETSPAGSNPDPKGTERVIANKKQSSFVGRVKGMFSK